MSGDLTAFGQERAMDTMHVPMHQEPRTENREPRRISPLRMPANQSIKRTPSGAVYFQRCALRAHHRDLVQYFKLVSFKNLQAE